MGGGSRAIALPQRAQAAPAWGPAGPPCCYGLDLLSSGLSSWSASYSRVRLLSARNCLTFSSHTVPTPKMLFSNNITSSCLKLTEGYQLLFNIWNTFMMKGRQFYLKWNFLREKRGSTQEHCSRQSCYLRCFSDHYGAGTHLSAHNASSPHNGQWLEKSRTAIPARAGWILAFLPGNSPMHFSFTPHSRNSCWDKWMAMRKVSSSFAFSIPTWNPRVWFLWVSGSKAMLGMK